MNTPQKAAPAGAGARSETGTRRYAYFCNRECEYFPCHSTDGREEFNCLFCYCPLYPLGKNCGGNFKYLPNGRKDCSGCIFPHLPENYDAVVGRYREIADAMTRMENVPASPAPKSGR